MKHEKVTIKCPGCGKEHQNHNFEYKTLFNDGKFWVASGPYDTEDEADEVIVKALETIKAGRA